MLGTSEVWALRLTAHFLSDTIWSFSYVWLACLDESYVGVAV
jgi:membrane-associated PAP2 superfamily phosphatase